MEKSLEVPDKVLHLTEQEVRRTSFAVAQKHVRNPGINDSTWIFW